MCRARRLLGRDSSLHYKFRSIGFWFLPYASGCCVFIPFSRLCLFALFCFRLAWFVLLNARPQSAFDLDSSIWRTSTHRVRHTARQTAFQSTCSFIVHCSISIAVCAPFQNCFSVLAHIFRFYMFVVFPFWRSRWFHIQPDQAYVDSNFCLHICAWFFPSFLPFFLATTHILNKNAA